MCCKKQVDVQLFSMQDLPYHCFSWMACSSKRACRTCPGVGAKFHEIVRGCKYWFRGRLYTMIFLLNTERCCLCSYNQIIFLSTMYFSSLTSWYLWRRRCRKLQWYDNTCCVLYGLRHERELQSPLEQLSSILPCWNGTSYNEKWNLFNFSLKSINANDHICYLKYGWRLYAWYWCMTFHKVCKVWNLLRTGSYSDFDESCTFWSCKWQLRFTLACGWCIAFQVWKEPLDFVVE